MTPEEQLAAVVASMRREVKSPMKTWSAGEVIASDKVDDWADELQPILAELQRAQGDAIAARDRQWVDELGKHGIPSVGAYPGDVKVIIEDVQEQQLVELCRRIAHEAIRTNETGDTWGNFQSNIETWILAELQRAQGRERVEARLDEYTFILQMIPDVEREGWYERRIAHLNALLSAHSPVEKRPICLKHGDIPYMLCPFCYPPGSDSTLEGQKSEERKNK